MFLASLEPIFAFINVIDPWNTFTKHGNLNPFEYQRGDNSSLLING